MTCRRPWVVYLWPGLPELYARGSLVALALAIGMAVLLNLAVLGSFGYRELFTEGMRTALWVVVTAGWPLSALFSAAQARRDGASVDDEIAEADYGEALNHYLKGDWFHTERILVAILQRNPRDLDARLMLATLYRRTQRYDEAHRQLDQLARVEGAHKWALEIHRELELLAEESGKSEETEAENIAAETSSADVREAAA